MACMTMQKKPGLRYGMDRKRYGVLNVGHRILPKKTRFARDAVDIFVRDVMVNIPNWIHVHMGSLINRQHTEIEYI